MPPFKSHHKSQRRISRPRTDTHVDDAACSLENLSIRPQPITSSSTEEEIQPATVATNACESDSPSRIIFSSSESDTIQNEITPLVRSYNTGAGAEEVSRRYVDVNLPVEEQKRFGGCRGEDLEQAFFGFEDSTGSLFQLDQSPYILTQPGSLDRVSKLFEPFTSPSELQQSSPERNHYDQDTLSNIEREMNCRLSHLECIVRIDVSLTGHPEIEHTTVTNHVIDLWERLVALFHELNMIPKLTFCGTWERHAPAVVRLTFVLDLVVH